MKMQLAKQIGLALTAGAFAAGTAVADDHKDMSKANPYMQKDDTWVSLNGTIDSVTRDSFKLNYGQGTIQVSMDDGDRDADGYKLKSGDKVTVNGEIDDDFFEKTTIEASSVYVDKLGTYFYASSMDEDDMARDWYVVPMGEMNSIFQGTITSIEDDEVILNTGMQSMRVETDELASDPLDDDGYMQLSVGDLVRVTGESDSDLFEGRVFEAETLTVIQS